jgi:hypothetical protein
MTSSAANDVLRRFNRDTAWLAVLLLSALIFAALACVFLIPEPRPVMAGLQGRASQAKLAPSLTADAAEPVKIADANAKRSANPVPSATLTHIDQFPAESSSKEPHAVTETAAASTPAPIVLPEPSPAIATANASNLSLDQPKESAQVIRGEAPYRRSKSAARLTDVEVKKRLIELWHQSLVRTEKVRGWAGMLHRARPWKTISELEAMISERSVISKTHE